MQHTDLASGDETDDEANLQPQRRILHVIESFGGGVSDAALSFVHNTPEFEHHLIYALRDDAKASDELFESFATCELMRSGNLARIIQVNRRSRSLGAVIIHAHSSYAGVYARLARSRRRATLVYSPHCFSFERTDLAAPIEGAYRLIERVLARNTTAFVACSPREAELARELGGGASTHLVVNVAHDIPAALPAASDEPLVSAAGRIVPQKGIPRFARLAKATRAHDDGVSFTWIGGGRPELTAELEGAGVVITGWLTKPEVLEKLSRSQLYVHTADWEGFPVGLLEALACGVPALVTDRPYAAGLPAEMVVSDAELVTRVRELLDDPDARARLLATGTAAVAENTSRVQAAQLRSAYSVARAARGHRVAMHK